MSSNQAHQQPNLPYPGQQQQQQLITNCQFYSIDLSTGQTQLARSKSLNDISNDSQIPAFASDRSINNNQQQLLNGPINNQDSNVLFNGQQAAHCMDFATPQTNNTYATSHPNNNNQQPSFQTHHGLSKMFSHDQINPVNNNLIGNLSFDYDESRSFNINQCSRPGVLPQQQSPIPPLPATSATNLFNICNPLAMNGNLNGVTEQIGNLHL